VLGRYLFAIGSNESTARLCGVNVLGVKLLVYALAGLLVALAGIYSFSLVKIANPTEGIGKELKFIAAVVIGGGSLSGGRGTVLGTLAGAAIMGVIASGCDQLEIQNSTQDIMIGIIIIAAVTLDQYRQRSTQR
jgi:ribose/xylose/arabinose/galactoside ABC-type transport system permease subunit